MSANQAQQQKTVLTDDGELREVSEAASAQAAKLEDSPVYCIHCGTPNRSVASFCRACGQALDNQSDSAEYERPRYATGSNELKAKRSEYHLSQPEARPGVTVPMMVFSLIRLAMIGGMLVTLVKRTNSIILPIAIVTAWILVEAVQNGAINPRGNRTQMTVPMMVFNTIKLAIVGGITVSLGAYGEGLINILMPLAVLVGWVLTEAFQAGAITPENK